VRLRLAADSFHLVTFETQGRRWIGNGPEGAALWRITAVDAAGWRVMLDGSGARALRAESRDGGLELHWDGVRGSTRGCPGTAGPFNVSVRAVPVDGRSGLLSWRIAVDNGTHDWTLWQVAFPLLGGLEPSAAPEEDRLFHPEGWGTQCTGWSDMPRLERRHRGWDACLQMLGLTRGAETFVLAVLDPGLATKDLGFDPGRNPDRRGCLSITTYPEGMGRAGNGYGPAYETLAGVIDGDWTDAAGLYGGWARAQSWAIRPASRTPGAKTFGEVTAWQVLKVPERPAADWVTSMERVARLLGTRIGIHFYEWHEVPFDVSYPDYFPARAEFADLVARMKADGIVTMPYINARLWDISAPSWSERRALRMAAKLAPSRLSPPTLFPYLEDYGSGQKLAPMCPTTVEWQDTVLDLCRRITADFGCDGVYLDQVAAAEPLLCFDPEHDHHEGGGSYWLRGYRQMLARIRAVLPAETFLTTECNWEGSIADFDGLLMWHSHGHRALSDADPTRLIPLFPMVYPGAATFGCNFAIEDLVENGGRAFAAKMGALLVWGSQLGWGDLTLLLEERFQSLAAFFRRLCALRAQHREVFERGRMLRPPRLDPEVPLLAALWRDAGGAVRLFVVNPTRESLDLCILTDDPVCRGRSFAADAMVRALADVEGFPACALKAAPLSAAVVELL
jgi:hypothetical protein